MVYEQLLYCSRCDVTSFMSPTDSSVIALAFAFQWWFQSHRAWLECVYACL